MKTSKEQSSAGYGRGVPTVGGLADEGRCRSIRGHGSGIVSYLPIRERGLDLSRAVTGGYVACQSASGIGTRLGDGGRIVVEKVSGEAGLVTPLDDGREAGGDSRSRDGTFGEGTRGKGEFGREDVRELV
jgi:hypothetical protein